MNTTARIRRPEAGGRNQQLTDPRHLSLAPCLWLWPLLVLAVGCSSLSVSDPSGEGISEKRQQRTEEAVRSFESSRDSAQYQAALACWNQHDVKGCEEGLRRLLQRNPNYRDAQLLMAEVYLTSNRPQEAFNCVEQALAAHPNDARVQYTMGLLLDTTGQSTGALAYYRQAAKLEPGNEVYAVGYQTAVEAAGDQRRDARGEGRGAGSTAPPPSNSPEAPVNSLRFVSPAEPTDRADPAGSAEVTDMGPTRGLIDKGHAALAEGSLEAAAVYFQEAAATSPNNPQIPISAALAALRYNRPDLAVELLTAAKKRFSGSVQLHRILGVAHYRLGDYKSSQVALQQALSLDKSSALSYFLMGCTLVKLGQFESAEAHLLQARTINPRYAVRR